MCWGGVGAVEQDSVLVGLANGIVECWDMRNTLKVNIFIPTPKISLNPYSMQCM